MNRRNPQIVVTTSILTVAIGTFLLSCSKSPAKPQTEKPSAALAAAPAAAPPPDAMELSLNDIVARYRKTIVLLDDDADAQAADRDRASLVGKIIFQENHQAISQLSEQLSAEIEKVADFSKPLPGVERFLDLVETKQELHDADKLVFREIFADLTDTLSSIKSTAQAKRDLEARIDSDRKALAEIQSLYEKELDKIFGRFATRGIEVHREAWERYVAYLHTKYKREDILKTYSAQLGEI